MDHINSYTGGIDRDINKHDYPNTKYYYLHDFRILTQDGLSSGALENIKGNKVKFVLPNALLNDGIIFIGSGLVRDELVIFGYSDSGAYDVILYTKEIDSPYTLVTLEVIWQSNSNTGRLYFDKQFRIMDAVPRYENTLVRKLYWTDNNNVFRYLNIDTLIKDYNVTGPSTFAATKFDSIPNVDLSIPKLTAIEYGGSLKAGVIQYSYQLYIPNGAATKISPLSNIIHLTTEDEHLANSQIYKGATQGTNTGKAVTIDIGTIDPRYNRIRVYSVFYADLNTTPTISLIKEDTVGSSYSFIDNGTNVLATLTHEEYQLLGGEPFVCKTLAEKDGYIFPANIHDSFFDIDYDARAYRAMYYNGSYHTDIWTYDGTNWIKTDVGAIGYANVPFEHDCINLFNDVTNKAYGSGYGYPIPSDPLHALDTNRFIYAYDPITGKLGGRGLNVTYKFKARQISLDGTLPSDGFDYYSSFFTKKENNNYIVNGETYNNNSYEGTSSPFLDGLYRGFQRDEVYRFGVVFVNAKKQRSFVHWIGDIRIPSHTAYDIPWGVLGITFTLNNIPIDPDTGLKYQYQIVYVKREAKDRTILFQGTIGKYYEPTNSLIAGAGVYLPQVDSSRFDIKHYVQANTSIYGMGDGAGTNQMYSRMDLVEFISPEININKNYTYKKGDYIQLSGLYTSRQYVVSDAITAGLHNNLYHKFEGGSRLPLFAPAIESYEWYNPNLYITDIKDGKVIPYSWGGRDDVGGNIVAGFTTYDYSETGSLGTETYKGTTLILALNAHSVFKYTNNIGYGLTGINFINDCVTHGSDLENEFMLVNYRQQVGRSQYGGDTYEQRLLNEYIECSQLLTGGIEQDVFGGDTFLGYFDYLRMFWMNDRASSMFNAVYIPLESSINLNLMGSDWASHLRKHDNNQFHSEWELLQESAGITNFPAIFGTPTITQTEDLYLYNSVYSKLNDTVKYYPLAFDFLTPQRQDVLIRASEKKINGEYVDSWTVFKENNVIEVDTAFGPINKLSNVNNQILAIQDKAVSFISINLRSVIQDNNTVALALGSGGILDRYDYLTTNSGSKHHGSVITTANGLYYYDVLQCKLVRFSKQEEPISEISGMYSWFSKEVSDNIKNYDNCLYYDGTNGGGIIGVWDKKNKQVFMTFKDLADNTKSFTIGYNESFQFIEGFYSFKPQLYIPGEQDYYSYIPDTYPAMAYIHNYGTRGHFYSDPYSTSIIQYVINPGHGKIGIYNNIEYITEVLTFAGVDIYDETMSYIKVWSDYQDAGTITLVPNTNIKRRIRTWRMVLPRDTKVYSPRLRGQFIYIELGYVNNNNNRLILHNLTTKITPSQL